MHASRLSQPPRTPGQCRARQSENRPSVHEGEGESLTSSVPLDQVTQRNAHLLCRFDVTNTNEQSNTTHSEARKEGKRTPTFDGDRVVDVTRDAEQLGSRVALSAERGKPFAVGLCAVNVVDQLIRVGARATQATATRNRPHQSPPRRQIVGATATVSTLATVEGQPYSPQLAGNGGFRRGLPGLPSRLSISPVSSPQMYAPAPRCR